MADIAHVVGSDLAVGPTGDLAVVDLADWTQQRVLRRLLTNPGGYIWQLTYGAGLPIMVGTTVSVQQTAAIIRRQIGLEAAVSQQPEPVVVMQGGPSGTVFATVTYQDAQTGVSQNLDIPGAG